MRCIRLYYISDQSFFLKISVKVFLKDIVASQRPIKNINTLIVAAYFYLQFPALPLESFSIYDPMQQYLTRNTGIPPRVFHFKGNLNFVYLLSRLKLIKCIVLKYWLKYCMRYSYNKYLYAFREIKAFFLFQSNESIQEMDNFNTTEIPKYVIFSVWLGKTVS